MNPSLLVLKIYGKANFLKMLTDVDHDNLRTVLLQNFLSHVTNIKYQHREDLLTTLL